MIKNQGVGLKLGENDQIKVEMIKLGYAMITCHSFLL